MPWKVKYDPCTDIVEVIIFGHVLGDDLKAAAIERIRQQKKFRTLKVLVDASAIEHLFAGTLDVFVLPHELYVSQNADRNTLMALMLPKNPKARETGQFFETACLNRGWLVRTFDDSQEALAWLKGASSSHSQVKTTVYNYT